MCLRLIGLDQQDILRRDTLLLEGFLVRWFSTRFIGRMKLLPSKQKAKDVRGPSELGISTRIGTPPNWAYDRPHEPPMPLNNASGNIGIVLDVKVRPTPTGFEKPSEAMRSEAVQLLSPEETAKLEASFVLHELTCGGKLEWLPDWVFEDVKCPGSWLCIECNTLTVPGREETYLG